MLSIKIPYPKTDTIFGEICYPGLVVEVWLTSRGYQPFEFILDSGADCTLVPRFLANLTGTSLPSTPNAKVYGITKKPMPAYKGQLKLKIETEEFEVRCLFTESNKIPLLLGRVDFFSLFNVHFDNRNNQIVLERLN